MPATPDDPSDPRFLAEWPAAPQDPTGREMEAEVRARLFGDVSGPAVDDATGPTTPSSDRSAGLARGVVVDRHVLLDKLGAGGMGVVYAAYDPELDRKIALKLVLPSRSGVDGGRARLLREAQALARLSHPNVVAVHDVGTHDDQVWIAMEFVPGQTLGEWARKRPRRWPELLRVLTDVARGVAAAHAVGLVHRDLKPENVMIDRDERVRVMDFGLAHGRTLAVAEEEFAATSGTTDSALDRTLAHDARVQPEFAALAARLTQAGTIQGTPAYMSPEQWRGEEATPAADQYGWSVMAWELLYGERPYHGENLLTLAANVLTGRRRPSPRSRRVPGWLGQILQRGLQVDPARRFPGMDALLEALRRGRTRARVRNVLVGLGVASAAVVGGLALQHRATAQQIAACELTGDEISAVWNDETKLRLRDSLAATGLAYAAASYEKAIPWIDRWTHEWRDIRARLCRAANVEGSWSPEQHALSTACLEERRDELAGLLEVLTAADAVTAQRAVSAAASLAQLGPCTDAAVLARRPPLPEEQELRAAVQDRRRDLRQVMTMLAAGKSREGLARAEEVLVAAQELGYLPLTVEARALTGVAASRAGKLELAAETLTRAYEESGLIGSDEIAVDVATQLVYTLGDPLARRAEALVWSHAARRLLRTLQQEGTLREAHLLNNLAATHQAASDAAAARPLHEEALAIRRAELGPDHPTVALSLTSLGNVQRVLGNLREALALHEEALAIRRGTLTPDHPDVAASLNNLANVHGEQGDHEKALAILEEAQRIWERAYGPEDARVAVSLGNIASTYRKLGRYDEALATNLRVLEIRKKALGPDHTAVADSLHNTGNVHRDRGELEQALALLGQALAIYEAKFGADSPDVASTLLNIGLTRDEQGDHRGAIADYERALAIAEKTYGPDHKVVAQLIHNIADAHRGLRAYDEAVPRYERALATIEKVLGPEHPMVTYPLVGLGRVDVERGRPAAAIAPLERAVALRERGDEAPDVVADAHFALAEALWDAPPPAGRDRSRAHALATRALAEYRAAGSAGQQVIPEVEAWLRGHTP
ncbi:serine/threonine-protein kinase [Nannocystis punicea]|uniref:Serine/threonine-protein kinase n=1 Tax=Nannocystis punicea TaxID=2995304 RepID=A0ABY7GUZ6_9BACT|nr:serine/threonine-protein kinase [Nannocystis poenicansa]WAS90654.1 serine/threonine-protein kinase [Nannocystis poenicansa]